MPQSKKSFLFLQGPHGPFFAQLAEILVETGARVGRVSFNAGDEHFWPGDLPLYRFLADHVEWPRFFTEKLEAKGVTDLVLYGDTRAIHSQAITIARAKDIRIHVFEEGYLRPYWVTYERNGVNGNSALMDLSVDQVAQKRSKRHVDLQSAPAQWGALWHHNWYGFSYHFAMAIGMRKYPNYRPHRDTSIWQEVRLNALRLLGLPLNVLKREWQTRKFILSGSPFFVALLQLEHDASLKFHSNYTTQESFIWEAVEQFARHAPKHYRLVFKLHPLDDRRAPIEKWIAQAGHECGVERRVISIYGGKLGALMTRAKAALAINSTSTQQAMWRGIPVKIMGRSVFGKPEFTSDQTLAEFMEAPKLPNKEAFLEYRSYLLETSQIGGGFYTSSGRAEVLRNVVDSILSGIHPYDK